MKTVSIIVPVYNEAENIWPCYAELKEHTGKIAGYEWEFIFVNDGSSDCSIEKLHEIAKTDPHVVVIDFSRNFGKEIALTAGVAECSGDAAIFLDADLQHPPCLIPDFLKKWEAGAEVVSSVRKTTVHKSPVKDLGSKIFYAMLNKYSDTYIKPNTTDFKLIDRKVINELKKFTERNRMFRGLIDWLGFKTDYIEFVAPERVRGKATYSLKKLCSLAINSLTSFSLFPLRIAGYLGVFITAVSFVLLCVMFVCNFILKNGLFTSIAFVIVSNTIILGIVLIALGLIALYIGQIHDEVVNRPLYVIRDRIQYRE